ncbi:Ig-like domain-containing protein [Sporosarcina obsidiansis]|uniref:Ig-like domain-containing protein n=1 Tax=Sporosarcina obsidiansis TaxID=2660748 RepID=UPI00129B59DA|nr:Ig-like domain-containing protein [Sporosarcina obsidiansis]
MRLRIITAFACIGLLLTGLFSNQTTHAAGIQSVTDPMKPWTITFNQEVLNQTDNLHRISMYSKDQKVSLSLSADSKKVTVKPQIPYLFGEIYTLTIPSDFRSDSGKVLKTAVTKEFEITGQYIQAITAVANPFVTNINVQTNQEVFQANFSVNQGTPIKMIRNLDSFSKGQLGLTKGDMLTIEVFDQQERLLETQYYEVK